MQLILGTRTSGNINLVAQLLMLAAVWVGFYFARTNQIRRHRDVETAVVLTNMFFIAFVMIPIFFSYVILGDTTTGTVAVLMILHGSLGLIAELVGLYLVLRMRTHLIPPRFRIRNFELVMRALLLLWTLIVVLGLGIYYFRYLAAPEAAAARPIAHLKSEADAIALHSEELQAALRRGNLATTRRHAEHLVNLIEGKPGADYGDLDKDGVVEDPGDGVGALVYLQQVRAEQGGSSGQIGSIADQVQSAMFKIVADSKVVLLTRDMNAVAGPAAELGALASQIKSGTTNSVPQLAQLLGASPALPTVAPVNAGGASNAVTVNLQDFKFAPKSLTITKGTTVVFVNLDNVKHTVTEDDGTFDSRDIPPGGKFTFTFTETGTFPYYCQFHGDRGGVDMAGTVVVH